MLPIDHVLRDIEAKAAAVGFSKWGLAEFAGLHKNSLRGLFTPDWTPSVSTIRRIQDALRPPVPELRRAARARGITLTVAPSRPSRPAAPAASDAEPAQAA